MDDVVKKKRSNTGVLFPIIKPADNGPTKKGDINLDCPHCGISHQYDLLIFRKLDKNQRPYEVINLKSDPDKNQ